MPCITDVPGVLVGHAQDDAALTGCTAVLTMDGAVAGVDVRGSAPGTRETDLMRPCNLVERVHAVVLAGGSAYGLDAACGAMEFLEERGVGFATGFGVVPIVGAAVIFDLDVGDPRVRPDRRMGHAACAAASADPPLEGNAGAGLGATIGKLWGFAHAMKGGVGTWAMNLPLHAERESGPVVVGAIVVVNALGDVVDPVAGQVIAGAYDRAARRFLKQAPAAPAHPGWASPLDVASGTARDAHVDADVDCDARSRGRGRGRGDGHGHAGADTVTGTHADVRAGSDGGPDGDSDRDAQANGCAQASATADISACAEASRLHAGPCSRAFRGFGANTTLAVVATNAGLDKEGANKVAQMAHDGLARVIRPVHTMYDGDVVFALSTGDRPFTGNRAADITALGAAAADAVAVAVVRAVKAATAAGGVPAARDIGA